ncbi:RsiV family protein [Breznakiella homolactica]|uniref:DUF3298 domain-containing protein n=1 Tax=Breznakiella homolactica TaxID=2798577 RepID=A0A7T8BB68_9SPIR|nr:RsiV family protein [Breznakiella homolactica]QQO08928.1 RsiV family protein [Breznakiella homolactica]
MSKTTEKRAMYHRFPALAGITLIILTSCVVGGKPREDMLQNAGISEGIRADGFRQYPLTAESILYPEYDKKSPRIVYTFDLLEVTGSRTLAEGIYGTMYQGQEPKDYARRKIDDFNRENSNPGDIEMYLRLPPSNLTWEYTESTQLQSMAPGILVTSREYWYYTGGAHGMGEKTYFVFDIETSQRLSVGDVFTEQAMPELAEYIQDALRVWSEIPPGAPLTEGGFFEDTVEVPEDFFLSPQGAGFQWDQYEIAPYAWGQIEVVLPEEKISGLLTEKGAELLRSLAATAQ